MSFQLKRWKCVFIFLIMFIAFCPHPALFPRPLTLCTTALVAD